MVKTSKVFLNIAAVFCFIYGAVYIFSLIFIPIGIYCFLAAKRFVYKADHINDYYSLDKKIFRNYVIFASIACFPFGLLSIIPYVILTGNNIKVKTTEVKDSQTISESENKDNSNDIKVEDVKGQDNITSETVTEVKVENPETEEEKQEKFKKLQNFKEKGLITDDELEMAREQLFGKKEDK